MRRIRQIKRLAKLGLAQGEIAWALGVTPEYVRRCLGGSGDTLPPNNAMLRTAEVARLLGVHENTVRRWESDGRLKAIRLGSRGDRRFWAEDVHTAMETVRVRGEEEEPQEAARSEEEQRARTAA